MVGVILGCFSVAHNREAGWADKVARDLNSFRAHCVQVVKNRRIFGITGNMARRRRKKRGRPATGRDPIVPVRLPAKLLRDIDAWSSVYRDEFEGMDRSTAIRCLLLLGLGSVRLRVVDPKDKTTFEGATLPLLKFYRSGTIDRWLGKGTGTYARRRLHISRGGASNCRKSRSMRRWTVPLRGRGQVDRSKSDRCCEVGTEIGFAE